MSIFYNATVDVRVHGAARSTWGTQIMLKYSISALALITSPAVAQDGLRFYAGPVVGYDHVNIDAVDQATGATIELGTDSDMVYGGTAGIDYRFAESGTFGVEAEFTDSKVGRSGSDLITLGDTGRISAGRDLYIGVRAAYFLAPRVLFYAKAGYTNARVNVSYDDGAGTVVRGHSDRDGFRFGPGVEFVLTKNIGLRAEYRRSEYKKFDTGFGYDLDANRDQFVAGVVAGF